MSDYLMRVVQAATRKSNSGVARPAVIGMPGPRQVMLAQRLPGSGWVDGEPLVEDGQAEWQGAPKPIAPASTTVAGSDASVASDPPTYVAGKVRDEPNPLPSTVGPTQPPSSISKTTPVVIMPKALRPGRPVAMESVARPDASDSRTLADPAERQVVGATLRPPFEHRRGIALAGSNFHDRPEARSQADLEASAPVPGPSAERLARSGQIATPMPREPAQPRVGVQSIEAQAARAHPDESETLATVRQADAARSPRNPAQPPSRDDRAPIVETPRVPGTSATPDVSPATPRAAEWLPTVARSAQTELPRISIGRVDVQVNNLLPAPLAPGRSRETASRRHELEARYLDRFWLRP